MVRCLGSLILEGLVKGWSRVGQPYRLRLRLKIRIRIWLKIRRQTLNLITEYWQQLTAFVMLVYTLSVMRVEIGVLQEMVAGFLNLDII